MENGQKKIKNIFKKYIVVLRTIRYLLILGLMLSHNAIAKNTYLYQPTGRYKVGFQDFHWVNSRECPDFNFTGKNEEDFSQSNINHCHEIMARIYYPTHFESKSSTLYYEPFVKWQQKEFLRKLPGIDKKQIEQLNQLTSFSLKKAPIAKDVQFPVLLFSPGFNFPAQIYENFITELVSHGYMVIAVNTPFINLTALPNGHIVEATSSMTNDELENKLVPLQARDVMYVYNKIHKLHHVNALFKSMDLNHIGLLGHSIGARVLADVVHANPNVFQAAVTLDIGIDETGASLKKFNIPFMHVIAADRKLIPPGANIPPVIFELGTNGFLVGLTPNEKESSYSSHDNFSDLSSLQYLPAFQTLSTYQKQRYEEGFNLVLLSHAPSKQECEHFANTSYVLIKKGGEWHFSIYENKEIAKNIDVSMVAGLEEVLQKLPNKPPEQFSSAEIKPIQEVMDSLHYILFGKSFLGNGDGWNLTRSINTYLVRFFDTFLKKNVDVAFEECSQLSIDTYLKCGPGVF